MALANNSSYIPTTNEFLAHWDEVNAALPPAAPFIPPAEVGVIPPGFNRSGLLALRDVLQSHLDAVQDDLNDVQIAGGALVLQKAKLYRRLELFLGVVDGFYGSTEFAAARPEAPGIGAGEERFMDPLRDAKSLWGKLNAAAAPSGLALPVVLDEGQPGLPALVTLAQFTASMEDLKVLFEARAVAEQKLRLTRGRRDKTMRDIRTVLVRYRAAVLVRIAGNVPLIDSIPRVTPAPGHTPEPVQVSGAFQAPDQAVVSHTESEDADLRDYQLVGAVGEEAVLEDAVALDTHEERVPVDFVTGFGLSLPGGVVSLWVVVRTVDGNERASERVVVARPG